MVDALYNYFQTVYGDALRTRRDKVGVAVLNNTNVDVLHTIRGDEAKKALALFKQRYGDQDVEAVIAGAIELAMGSGGEKRIDGQRAAVERFLPFLQARAANIKLTLGGNAGNAATALSALGASATLGGTLRNTSYGNWILGHLKEHGVDTQYLRIKSGTRTQATTYGIEIIGGDRAFLNDGGDNRTFNLSADLAYQCESNGFNAVMLVGLHNLTTGFDKALAFIKSIDASKTVVLTDSGDFSALGERKIRRAARIFAHAGIACFNENELAQIAAVHNITISGKTLPGLVDGARQLLEQFGNRPILNVHTKDYSFDIIYDCVDKHYKLTVLPGLSIGAIATKTGLGDGYVAGKTIGFLRGRGRGVTGKIQAGLALGNAAGACRAAHGSYCSLATLAKIDAQLSNNGIKEIDGFLETNNKQKKEFIKRGCITL